MKIEHNTKVIYGRLSLDDLRKLDELAKRNRRTRASEIRVILEDWLNENFKEQE